eukprot:m.352773 g.352773  ORF g.352773 m.352773 type:complete len:214 (+) comp16612_c0_seq1:1672-2313(+)
MAASVCVPTVRLHTPKAPVLLWPLVLDPHKDSTHIRIDRGVVTATGTVMVAAIHTITSNNHTTSTNSTNTTHNSSTWDSLNSRHTLLNIMHKLRLQDPCPALLQRTCKAWVPQLHNGSAHSIQHTTCHTARTCSQETEGVVQMFRLPLLRKGEDQVQAMCVTIAMIPPALTLSGNVPIHRGAKRPSTVVCVQTLHANIFTLKPRPHMAALTLS